jgi:hypothetical protein
LRVREKDWRLTWASIGLNLMAGEHKLDTGLSRPKCLSFP